jgi:hypothetical protein
MLLAVLAWDAGRAGAGRESGPFVPGRLGRAFRSKCPQAAGTGLVTIAAAGLASFLADHGEWVVEIDRPKRTGRTQA